MENNIGKFDLCQQQNEQFTSINRLASVFIEHTQEYLKYSPVRDTWFLYTGSKWVRNREGHAPTSLAYEFLAAVSRLGHKNIKQFETLELDMRTKRYGKKAFSLEKKPIAFSSLPRWIRFSTSCVTMSNVKELLGRVRSLHSKSMSHVADNDPFYNAPAKNFLNLANCTYDLDLNTVNAFTHTDYIQECAPVAYNLASTCPRWTQFIDEITLGDQHMAKALQTFAGYTMSSSINERKIAVCIGKGANGKSVFTDVLRMVLGSDYATEGNRNLLVKNHNVRDTLHETAEIVGKRLVVISELDERAKWKTDNVKALTNVKELKAKFLYKQAFSFVPTHKIWLHTNYLPKITDPALQDRLVIFDFKASFYGNDRDVNLMDKLTDELEGIVLWMLEGWRMYQDGGLTLPEYSHAVVPKPLTEMELDIKKAVKSYHDFKASMEGFKLAFASDVYKSFVDRGYDGTYVAFMHVLKRLDVKSKKKMVKGERQKAVLVNLSVLDQPDTNQS